MQTERSRSTHTLRHGSSLLSACAAQSVRTNTALDRALTPKRARMVQAAAQAPHAAARRCREAERQHHTLCNVLQTCLAPTTSILARSSTDRPRFTTHDHAGLPLNTLPTLPVESLAVRRCANSHTVAPASRGQHTGVTGQRCHQMPTALSPRVATLARLQHAFIILAVTVQHDLQR